MVSHDVEFCAKYADQVSMFFDGQVLTTATPAASAERLSVAMAGKIGLVARMIRKPCLFSQFTKAADSAVYPQTCWPF